MRTVDESRQTSLKGCLHWMLILKTAGGGTGTEECSCSMACKFFFTQGLTTKFELFYYFLLLYFFLHFYSFSFFFSICCFLVFGLFFFYLIRNFSFFLPHFYLSFTTFFLSLIAISFTCFLQSDDLKFLKKFYTIR